MICFSRSWTVCCDDFFPIFHQTLQPSCRGTRHLYNERLLQINSTDKKFQVKLFTYLLPCSYQHFKVNGNDIIDLDDVEGSAWMDIVIAHENVFTRSEFVKIVFGA